MYKPCPDRVLGFPPIDRTLHSTPIASFYSLLFLLFDPSAGQYLCSLPPTRALTDLKGRLLGEQSRQCTCMRFLTQAGRSLTWP
jgi:hypothetical protein